MLLDPLEKEFDLPAAFVELCDRECRQRKVVGQKDEPLETEVSFGLGDKEGRGLMDSVKTGKVRIPSVQNIDRSGFYRNVVEDVDLVNSSMGTQADTQLLMITNIYNKTGDLDIF